MAFGQYSPRLMVEMLWKKSGVI